MPELRNVPPSFVLELSLIDSRHGSPAQIATGQLLQRLANPLPAKSGTSKLKFSHQGCRFEPCRVQTKY